VAGLLNKKINLVDPRNERIFLSSGASSNLSRNNLLCVYLVI